MNEVSLCCRAPLIVAGSDEGTSYYLCSNCKQPCDPVPKNMPIYEIWTEGYMATGEHGKAMQHGTRAARNFIEACQEYAKAFPEFGRYYNPLNNTYWGCRLFDNRIDAQRSYG